MRTVKDQTVNIFKFKGTATKEEMDKALLDNDCTYGDVVYCVDDECSYVRVVNDFIRIDPVKDLYDDGSCKHKRIIEKCYRCGASLPLSDEAVERGYVKCSYCRSTCKTFEWVE